MCMTKSKDLEPPFKTEAGWVIGLHITSPSVSVCVCVCLYAHQISNAPKLKLQSTSVTADDKLR